MRIGVFIPFKAQVVAGKAIGRMMHPFMHKLRSTAYSNISHCFPEKNNLKLRD
jgi:KDO2-lipid IV(A) lauroyltransferase